MSDAWIAISKAVSQPVADLADHDHVRVLTQERAQRGGEGQPDAGCICTWPTPGISYSTGSSAVGMLSSGRVDARRHAERGRLAGAGGAGDEEDAVRARDEVVQRLEART
ncbi:MAG: hypothetical protein R3B82_22480 [Sandaracinaceae bacterium]